MEDKQPNGPESLVLDEWMKAYGRDVINLAYAYVHNYHQAQDITQDVFLKAFSRMHTFRGDSSIKTWLLSITANRCRDYLRSWSKRNELFDETPISMKHSADDTERAATENVAKDELWQAVRKLPVPYREVLILYYQRDMSSQEVAQVLDITEQSVRTRLHRARTMLREIYKGGEVHGAN